MFMLLFVLMVFAGQRGLSVPLNFLVATDLIAALAWRRWGYGSLEK